MTFGVLLLLLNIATAAASPEPCLLLTPNELIGCEYQKVDEPLPLKIVSSYEDYKYEDTFTMSEKEWNAGETSLSSRHYSQICRSVQQTEDIDKAASGKCDIKAIPRGSIVSIIRTLPHPSKPEAELYLVRVMSLSNKYSGLAAKISKSLIENGEIGIMPSTYLKTPATKQLFVDEQKNPYLIDREDNGYHQYHCGGRSYLSLFAMSRYQNVVSSHNVGAFSQRFLDLSCSFEGETYLRTSTTADLAYKFLAAVNHTFDPSLVPAFTVGDFSWNEEGLVNLPWFEYQSSEDDEPDIILTINNLEGVGPQNRYFTYNQSAGEFKKNLDRWGTPQAVCSTFALAQKWVDEVCPTIATDTTTCSPQLGDMAFHSPTVKGLKDRSPLGLSKDPIGHRTHSSGNCIDIRLLAPDRFVHGQDSSADVLSTTNLFLKTAFELGAVDLFFARPNSTTEQFVRIKNDHSDHIHLCFASPAEREAGYHQSLVSVTSLREGKGIFPLRMHDLEASRTDPKLMAPYPIMPVRQNSALDECYSF